MAASGVSEGPRTYAELMADPASDPCIKGTGGAPLAAGVGPTPGYASIFARWRVADANPSVAQVHRDLLTDFTAPIGAVGYFVSNGANPTGILKVTHGYSVFTGLPTDTVNRGKTFGYVDDVVGGLDVNTFELDPTHLARTVEVRCVPTPERHLELLQDEPAADTVGPVAEDALTQAIYRTRKAMYIPYGLVEYVIGKDLTAREAFEILWPVIESKGWQTVAQPLVRFLMIASTTPEVGLPPATLLPQLGFGPVGAADVLGERRERVLYQQLPALALRATPATGGVGDLHMTALIAQVELLNDHTRLDRQDRQATREKAVAPKTIRERFQDYVTDKLLVLTDSCCDEDLPRLYHELAARQKGVSKRMVLQQAYDIAATDLQLNRLPASPSHVLCLDQWDFVGISMDTLGTGLLPFSIVPPDAPSKLARQAMLDEADRARQYDMSGEAVAGSISATDAKRLFNAHGYVASQWAEADIQLELYGVILGAILGTQHAVTRGHLASYQGYTRIRTRLQAAMNHKYGTSLAPALLVFHFQLHYRHWFEQRFTYGSPNNPAPEVTAGFTLFSTANRLDWVPSYDDVPALVALATRPGPGGPPANPAGRSPRAAPTPPLGGGAPGAAPYAAPDRVQNPHRNVRYIGNTPIANSIKTRSIRTAITTAGAEPPTVVREGRTVATCLSWHLKGMCTTTCFRKVDHVSNSPEEKELLWAWAQPAFA